VIAAYGLDGDRDLVFFSTDEWAGLEKCPLATRAPKSRSETA
jgi:hypothetical protein